MLIIIILENQSRMQNTVAWESRILYASHICNMNLQQRVGECYLNAYMISRIDHNLAEIHFTSIICHFSLRFQWIFNLWRQTAINLFVNSSFPYFRFCHMNCLCGTFPFLFFAFYFSPVKNDASDCPLLQNDWCSPNGIYFCVLVFMPCRPPSCM